MSVFEDLQSSFRGSLFGMAVCEALASCDTPGFKPGSLGPNTSMTICVAQAAIEDGGYQHDKFTYVKKLMEWYKSADPSERGGYIMRSLALALSAWDRHLAVASAMGNRGEDNEHWEVKKSRFDAMQTQIDLEFAVDYHQDGTSLARTAPIGLYYSPEDLLDESHLRIWAMQLSSLTHPHPTNRVLSSLYCELVHFALFAGSKRAISHPGLSNYHMDKEWLAKVFAEQVDHLSVQSDDEGEHNAKIIDRLRPYREIEAWKAKPIADLGSTNSALDAFEAALWCLFAPDTFREGATEAANLGGHLAMIGAMYGALAGAYYGYGEIPPEWISEIHTANVLETVADGLVRLREKLMDNRIEEA